MDRSDFSIPRGRLTAVIGPNGSGKSTLASVLAGRDDYEITAGQISFQGEGCAICTASTSLMTEAVKGKSVTEAHEIFEGFHHMLTGVADEQGVELGKLQVFEGVREYPVRVKCATLAWHTLNAAMDGDDEKVTTE